MGSDSATRVLDFELLGAIRIVRADGEPAPILGSLVQRAVLGLLLLHVEDGVSTERLLESLWEPEAGGGTATTLRSHVSRLRTALAVDPEVRIDSRAPGYRLRVSREQVDLFRFRRLAAEGRRCSERGDLLGAAACWEHALGLWRGAALSDLRGFSFAESAGAALDAQRLDLAEDLAAARLDSGRPDAAVAGLHAVLAEHPLRERSVELSMLGLYRCGRQAEALERYRMLRRSLVADLGLVPGPALQELERLVLTHDPVLAELPAGRAGPYPVRTQAATSEPTIGRREAVAAVRRLLADPGCVTLTGPGGVGKTHLAREVAARSTFADGYHFVELANLLDPTLLLAHVAGAVGLAAGAEQADAGKLLDRLAAMLTSRQILVVLDNCEHLRRPVGDLVDTLLSRCPRLSVLATSRTRLAMRGEAVWRVPPLPVPDRGVTDVGQLADSPALALFAARARRRDPSFRIHAGNALAIAEVCRRLDGMPLAIEIAAGRVEGAAVVPDRHRSVAACLEWGYDLLEGPDRILLRRLAVFAGSFDLESAEAVASGPDLPAHLVLDGLSRLTDASWTTVATGGRYRLPQAVREDALARLDAAGERDALHERHLRHATATVGGFLGPPLCVGRWWLRRVADDYDNVSAALGWAIDSGRAADATRIAGRLLPYWVLDGRVLEGRHWQDRVLRLDPPAGANRAWLRIGRGLLFFYCGQAAEALREWDLADAEAAGAAYALGYAGAVAIAQGEVSAGTARLRHAIAELVAADDPAGAAWCAFNLGWAALGDLDLPAAREWLAQATSAAEPLGSDVLAVHAGSALACVAVVEGLHREAVALAEEALSVSRRLDLAQVRVMCLIRAAEAAVLAGDVRRAAAHVVEALRTCADTGGRNWVADAALLALLAAPQDADPTALAFLAGAGSRCTRYDTAHHPFSERLAARGAQIRSAVGDGYEAAHRSGTEAEPAGVAACAAAVLASRVSQPSRISETASETSGKATRPMDWPAP
ncbi:MAG: BTAD domain-containing putative transcriptional regulator [Sporichthyaceae bacterium]